MQHMKRNQRGDTLIEVLIAITVLGTIVAGCMAVMNRSLVSILNSAERTASRSDINTQTDLLNYVYRSDKTTWNKIMDIAYAGAADGSAPNNVKDVCTLNAGSRSSGTKRAGSFYLQPTLDAEGGISSVALVENLNADTHGMNKTQRAVTGQGLWVDAIHYPQSTTNQRSYVDFYIKACWTPLGGLSHDTNSRSVTTVRIYNYAVDDNANYNPDELGAYLTVINSYSSSNKRVTFNWNTTMVCPAYSPIEYQYRFSNSGAWILTTAKTAQQTVTSSGTYPIQVQARCSNGEWGEIIQSAYNTPAAPATPTVNSSLSGNTITFTWSTSSTCPSGTSKQYQYRQGSSGAWSSSTTSTSFAWANTAYDNSYTFQVQARCDDFGLWSSTGTRTHSRPVPAAPATPTVNSSLSGNTITFTWSTSSTCPSDAAKQYQYRLNNGSWVLTSNTMYAWTGTSYGNSYKVDVQARCGNVGTWSSTGTRTHPLAENVKPTVSATNSSATWRNANVSAAISAADNAGGSGLDGVRYSIGSSNPFTSLSTCKSSGSGTSNGATLSISTTGGTRLYLCAYDKAGNYATWNGTYNIDKTAPTCSSSGGSTSWTNGNRTLTGTCSDTGGSGCTGNVTRAYSSNINSTAESPGTVKDNAGNTTTCPSNQTVRIDKTAPTCSSSGGSTSWTNGNRTLTGTCSDTGGSGCTGNVTKAYSSATNITNGSPGSVKDNAGNTTTCPSNQTVRIEKTAGNISCHRKTRSLIAQNYASPGTEAGWWYTVPTSGVRSDASSWTGFYANLSGYTRFWMAPGTASKTSGFTVYAWWSINSSSNNYKFAGGRNNGWGDGYMQSNAGNTTSVCTANF